jgi:hypothetical protein
VGSLDLHSWVGAPSASIGWGAKGSPWIAVRGGPQLPAPSCAAFVNRRGPRVLGRPARTLTGEALRGGAGLLPPEARLLPGRGPSDRRLPGKTGESRLMLQKQTTGGSAARLIGSWTVSSLSPIPRPAGGTRKGLCLDRQVALGDVQFSMFA